MKTRILHTKIWKDSYFATLTKEEKLLFIYFITNEYVNIIHLYECPTRTITFDTSIAEDQITRAKNKFQADKKLYFHKDFVYITNASRYEEYKGEKNRLAISKSYSQLPKDVLDWYYSISDTPINTPIYTPSIGTINHKSEIINQKPETINQGGYQKFQEARELLVRKTTIKS